MEEGQELLLRKWDEVRKSHHDTTVTDQANVEAAATEMINFRKREKERSVYSANQSRDPTAYPTPLDTAFPKAPQDKTKHGFSQYYYGRLTGSNRANQAKLLSQKFGSMTGNRLLLQGDSIRYKRDGAPAWTEIGTLKKGFQGVVARPADPTRQREVYTKLGSARSTALGLPASYSGSDSKEYVADDRGVLTRRYAYVEKNYWQMMDFFMTGHHEGRFQAYMRAAGEANPNIYEARDEGVMLVRPTHDVGTLTREQLAVAHQKLGSGPQQRGVSLTATPKVNVTYVNTGENFRTDRGFRLKIDLARVPKQAAGGPLFMNHYSHSGVIDIPSSQYSTVRERGSTSEYPYKPSAVHARELYLEYLKPEWIVAIEQHDQGNKGATGIGSTTLDMSSDLKGGTLFALAKATFHGVDFETGFDVGLGTDTNPRPTEQDYSDGFGAARLFVDGWTQGHADFNTNGSDDATNASAARISVPQYIFDLSMQNRAHEDKYDMFRIGYFQGRRGAPLIASHAGLRS